MNTLFSRVLGVLYHRGLQVPLRVQCRSRGLECVGEHAACGAHCHPGHTRIVGAHPIHQSCKGNVDVRTVSPTQLYELVVGRVTPCRYMLVNDSDTSVGVFNFHTAQLGWGLSHNEPEPSSTISPPQCNARKASCDTSQLEHTYSFIGATYSRSLQGEIIGCDEDRTFADMALASIVCEGGYPFARWLNGLTLGSLVKSKTILNGN
jgi:hypothetical protein